MLDFDARWVSGIHPDEDEADRVKKAEGCVVNYYNENDPKAAAWLRELIKQGLIAPGEVDERSILNVTANDVRGYTQCHWFAGIGGWSYALRLAGWPDDRPVWTGSCPCQPFSVAGKGLAERDERHLWPVFFNLIRQCAPAIVLGEQVASKAALGWLDGVFADLEGSDYACAAADLCAAGVGAPHIRQRLYWVAEAKGPGRSITGCSAGKTGRPRAPNCGATGRLGDADGPGLSEQGGPVSVSQKQSSTKLRGDVSPWSDFDTIGCSDGKARRIESGIQPLANGVPARVGRLRGYGNAIVPQVAAEFIQAFVGAMGETGKLSLL